MNNEEKILQALELLNERQLNTETVLEELRKGQEKTNSRLNSMDARLDGIDNRLDAMQEDMEQIKEDTAITRSATNSLIEWADNVSVITQVKFPVKKPQ